MNAAFTYLFLYNDESYDMREGDGSDGDIRYWIGGHKTPGFHASQRGLKDILIIPTKQIASRLDIMQKIHADEVAREEKLCEEAERATLKRLQEKYQ